MYNWSEYISPDNIDKFKDEYGIKKYQYDIFDNNDVLMAKLQGGATGYDIASPTMNYLPAMIESGFLQKLDMSRIPNIELINPTFRKQWWDPDRGVRRPQGLRDDRHPVPHRRSSRPCPRRGRTSTT